MAAAEHTTENGEAEAGATENPDRRRIQRALQYGRIDKTIRGTAERPRLVVSRTHRHMQGQVVNDDLGVTLAGVSTQAPEVAEELDGQPAKERTEASRVAGRLLAERAREEGVRKVVFDRNDYPYHGRVEAFAEGAREGGLDF